MTKTYNMNLSLIGLCNDELSAVVHIGKLETILKVNMYELTREQQNAILAILAEHVASLDTSDLLTRLTK